MVPVFPIQVNLHVEGKHTSDQRAAEEIWVTSRFDEGLIGSHSHRLFKSSYGTSLSVRNVNYCIDETIANMEYLQLLWM